MTMQPQNFSNKFQQDVTVKVFHCKQFALYGTMHIMQPTEFLNRQWLLFYVHINNDALK